MADVAISRSVGEESQNALMVPFTAPELLVRVKGIARFGSLLRIFYEGENDARKPDPFDSFQKGRGLGMLLCPGSPDTIRPLGELASRWARTPERTAQVLARHALTTRM